MTLSQIYNDETLYGHTLAHLPHELWAFTTSEFNFYEQPDPGTLQVKRNLYILRDISYSKGNKLICRTEFFFEKAVLNTIEFIYRQILGPIATTASSVFLFPIGFTAKLIHATIRYVCSFAPTSTSDKVIQVWSNPDLYGHILTSAPAHCYEFTSANLNWHLRPDGSDRRTFILTAFADGRPSLQLESEYELVPFELFEFTVRRIVGGTLTLTAALISPVGLAAKGVHIASQSIF
jgi:hypothetical protein